MTCTQDRDFGSSQTRYLSFNLASPVPLAPKWEARWCVQVGISYAGLLGFYSEFEYIDQTWLHRKTLTMYRPAPCKILLDPFLFIPAEANLLIAARWILPATEPSNEIAAGVCLTWPERWKRDDVSQDGMDSCGAGGCSQARQALLSVNEQCRIDALYLSDKSLVRSRGHGKPGYEARKPGFSRLSYCATRGYHCLHWSLSTKVVEGTQLSSRLGSTHEKSIR